MTDNKIKTYTFEEISNILKTIQAYITQDKYIISQNNKRMENINFLTKYNLTTDKIKKIILNIEANDFCYGLQNDHSGFEHEILYVFCPQIELPYGDSVDVVDIYSKFNMIDGKQVVVISFHKCNYPIDYMFKQVVNEANNSCEEDSL